MGTRRVKDRTRADTVRIMRDIMAGRPRIIVEQRSCVLRPIELPIVEFLEAQCDLAMGSCLFPGSSRDLAGLAECYKSCDFRFCSFETKTGNAASDPIAVVCAICQLALMEGRSLVHCVRSQVLLLGAIILGGCNETERVGSHRFHVPSESLVPESDRPFFLPPAGEDGFIFKLNPTAALTEQRSVLVRELAMVCDRARGLKVHVNSTVCAAEDVSWRGRRWLKHGDETFWTFSPETPSGSPAPFVSCFNMEMPGHPGLCHATLAADDLALTISLNADELSSLEATYDSAVSKLRTWEM